jgi:hypothetical protein
MSESGQKRRLLQLTARLDFRYAPLATELAWLCNLSLRAKRPRL